MVTRSLGRTDVLDKVIGKARYAGDLRVEQMVYAAVVRSTCAHGSVLAVETKEALAVPGVLQVITGKDIPGITNQPFEKPMLANPLVRCVGDGVALVVAQTLSAARAAADLIGVTYAPLPFVFTPEEALAEDAPKLYPEGNTLCHYDFGTGDVAEGFNQADLIIERDYDTQRVQHVALEPEAAVAVPGTNQMTVYVPTNDPFNARRVISETLGLSFGQVRVIQPEIGGSFGGKSYDSWVLGARAALCASIIGRPCKMVYTREESITEGTKRHPYHLSYRVGVKKDGRLTAIDAQIVGDGGAYRSKSFAVASRSAVEACGAYRIPHVRAKVTLAFTNNVYSDALRGFGSPQVAFSAEVLMDEIAGELGIDPVVFRQINLLQENDMSAVGQRMTDVSLGDCLTELLEKFRWNERKKAIQSPQNLGAYTATGLGLALLFRGEGFGACGQGLDAAAVNLNLQKDGQIILLTSMAEVGNGCHNTLVNIVAQTLAISPTWVQVAPVDTGSVPDSGPTVATRGTVIIGGAAKDAAEKIKTSLLDVGAFLLGVPSTDLILKNETVQHKNDPNKSIPYVELVAKLYAGGGHGYTSGWKAVNHLHWDREKGQGEAYPSYAYGACAAQVTVDLETGQVTVDDFCAVHDVGKAFSLADVKGQINAGIAMGTGYALLEKVEMENGQVKNTNFHDYIIPTVLDMPNCQPIVLEKPGSFGPFGAKGLGEPVTCAIAPAIVNAIANATGFYVRSLPASLESMRQHLTKKGETSHVNSH